VGDAFKALAMGADAVGFGSAAEIAGCRAVWHATKECVSSIASQDPRWPTLDPSKRTAAVQFPTPPLRRSKS
jgi:glutamate synthase domain-containing protein 2